MSHSPTHWMRPILPTMPRGRHILLYVGEENSQGVVTPAVRRVWLANVAGGSWSVKLIGSYQSADELDSLLDTSCAAKGETTIWLLRGWTDLVLSGLAELMDAGVITWRYCSIGGTKVLIRGAWRSRKIIITSLGNWTGGRWDNWGDLRQDIGVARLLTATRLISLEESGAGQLEELAALRVLGCIVYTSMFLQVHRVAPTSAAAGMLVWRTWLGPTVTREVSPAAAGKGAKRPATDVFVAPLSGRPAKAREAERHVVYALTSRQLRRGLVEGPIYCVDIRSAYLLGLTTTPLPVMYAGYLQNPSLEEAAITLCNHTGLALVRIHSSDYYYPCRLNGRVVPCKGRFWTWLCGKELAQAYCQQHVAETWALYAWIGVPILGQAASLCMKLCSIMEKPEHCAAKKCWRSVYSSLVGRFAGWRKVWSDCTAVAGFGRWSTWVQADARTGNIVPHRAIAGKVQMLREKTDLDSAVPLLFGCVTAQVRWFMTVLSDMAGPDNVCNIVADSLWVNQEGWQRMQRSVSERGLAADNLKVKAIYDRAWLSGKAVAVVERDAKRQLILPGVLDGAAIDSTGHVTMDRADEWSGSGEPRAASGVRRRRVRYSAAKIVERYSTPAVAIPPGEEVEIALLDQSLLQPLHGPRSVDDA